MKTKIPPPPPLCYPSCRKDERQSMNNRQIIDNLSTRIAKRRGHQYWLVRIAKRFLSGNANVSDYADTLEQCLRDDVNKFPKFEDSLLRLGYFAVFCLFAIGSLATLLSYL